MEDSEIVKNQLLNYNKIPYGNRGVQRNIGKIEKVIWILYEIGFCSSFTVTLIFWIFLFNTEGKFEFQYSKTEIFNGIYGHVFTFAIMVVEAFISRHPAKFLHLVYTYIAGVFYVLCTLILHIIRSNHPGSRDAIPNHIYWFTDWETSATKPIMLCVVMLPVTVILQSTLLLIHFTRSGFKQC